MPLFSNAMTQFKVAILGASGGIGQPLSLLMKMKPQVAKLALYDIVGAKGVAADVGHVNSRAVVKGYVGDAELPDALKGANIVLIPAGVPRKPGMTRDDLFNINAGIVLKLAKACATHCPDAHICVISNPVNSTVPIVAETYKKAGVYKPSRLFGVTTLDSVRASTFAAEVVGGDAEKTIVPVFGGHSGPTIVPVLSQTSIKMDDEQVAAFTKRVQYGGDEVVKAKDGAGSATLSMAQAGARFAESLLRALGGESNIVEPAFIQSDQVPGVNYFATMITLGPEGVAKIGPVGTLNEFEEKLLAECVPDLKKNIVKGEEFVKANF